VTRHVTDSGMRSPDVRASNGARVLFLCSPRTPGADTAVHLLLLRSLGARRIPIHVAVPLASATEPSVTYDRIRDMEGVTVRPTDFGPSLFGRSTRQKLGSMFELVPAVASLLGLAAYIRRHRIQILHSTDRPRDAVTCAALASLTGAKSVIHVHVKYDDWMSAGVRWALGRADALIGVSRFVADSLVSGGFEPRRVFPVLNAIEPEKWDFEQPRAPGRATLGLALETPLIVSVARLFAWKGHAELIRAVAIVKETCPDVRLAIVGGDYPEGSGVSAGLAALARELGVADNVLLTGHRTDIASLLAASDVFALASFEEPFGLVFAEAMAMKRPVVALATGGTPEVVEHGKSGLLSPPGDVQALAANLRQLLLDPSLRARFGEYGRQRVEARFTPARLAGDIEDIYATLLR